MGPIMHVVPSERRLIKITNGRSLCRLRDAEVINSYSDEYKNKKKNTGLW